MEGIEKDAIRSGARAIYLGGANAENRVFYWRRGFQARKSLMQKGLPMRACHSWRLLLDQRHPVRIRSHSIDPTSEPLVGYA